jgi:hypothetical protein
MQKLFHHGFFLIFIIVLLCILYQQGAEFNMLDRGTAFADNPILAMPPRQSNETFLEAYEVVFILDNREKFGFVSSYRSRKQILYLLLYTCSYLWSLLGISQPMHNTWRNVALCCTFFKSIQIITARLWWLVWFTLLFLTTLMHEVISIDS